jgi:hypothetical protein
MHIVNGRKTKVIVSLEYAITVKFAGLGTEDM